MNIISLHIDHSSAMYNLGSLISKMSMIELFMVHNRYRYMHRNETYSAESLFWHFIPTTYS